MPDIRTNEPKSVLVSGKAKPDRPLNRPRENWDEQSEFVMFMRSSVKCRACEIIGRYGVSCLGQRLHVLMSGDFLVVTVADNLHRPGLSICGRKVMEMPGTMIFQLLAEPVKSAGIVYHTPAAGSAVLTWSQFSRPLKRRLVVAGVAEGLSCNPDPIFDAIESMDEIDDAQLRQY